MELPAEFSGQMRRQLGEEFSSFFHALQEPAPVSIRENPLKRVGLEENADRVKWHAEGVYLEERPVFTLDPLFHAGAYYVQEASSMFVAEAVRQLLPRSQPLRALDLAAAPGGKSTLLASVLQGQSLLLANEVIRSRYQVLRENLVRWGHPNTHSSNHDPRDFSALEGFFDLVLIDAPCSGEGMFRKTARAVGEWSPANVQLCAARQQRILSDALPLVRPGGLLLYCTCTYNDLENEDNAARIAGQPGFTVEKLNIPDAWNISARPLGYQFYPHRTRGEGFYLACFRRREADEPSPREKNPRPFRQLTPLPRKMRSRIDPWLRDPGQSELFQKPKGGILAIPESQVGDCRIISRQLDRFSAGVSIGAFKGKDFVPAHDLALSSLISGSLPALELDLDQALQFLKKEIPGLETRLKGWVLARYKGVNLGWMKVLNNRINNYLPREWRIRMDT